MEARARELAKARFARGNISASLALRTDPDQQSLEINLGRLDAVVEALGERDHVAGVDDVLAVYLALDQATVCVEPEVAGAVAAR